VCSQGFIIRSWLHTLPFSVYLHYAFGMPFLSAFAPPFYPSSYSNLSGIEIVVIAIAAIAAMAETTMIILFISDIPPWIIIWWSKRWCKKRLLTLPDYLIRERPFSQYRFRFSWCRFHFAFHSAGFVSLFTAPVSFPLFLVPVSFRFYGSGFVSLSAAPDVIVLP
jgi:hypothetical protein